MINTISWPKAIWEGENLFQLTLYDPSRRAIKARTQGRNLKDHGRALPTGSLLRPGSVCFSVPQDHLPKGVAPPTVGRVLPQQSWIKKMFPRLTYRPIWLRHFLHRGSLFAEDFSFCQVDEKNRSTPNHAANVIFLLAAMLRHCWGLTSFIGYTEHRCCDSSG